MLIREVRPVVVAVAAAVTVWGVEPVKGFRLFRVRVVFPDLGSRPFVSGVGFLRYGSERVSTWQEVTTAARSDHYLYGAKTNGCE